MLLERTSDPRKDLVLRERYPSWVSYGHRALMSTPQWEAAQDRELAWWAEIKNRLRDPIVMEDKRQASFTIWNALLEWGASEASKVLEIGTGGDGFVNFLPVPYRVGIEPLLLRMKAKAIGTFSPEARFVSGVGEHLPFKDRSFDVVILYNVLDHMSEPRSALDEIVRVLRQGGVLHLLVDTYAFRFKLYRRFVRGDPMHPHTFTTPEIQRWLRRRALEVVMDVSDMAPVGKRRARAFRAFCVLGSG